MYILYIISRHKKLFQTHVHLYNNGKIEKICKTNISPFIKISFYLYKKKKNRLNFS